MRQNLLTYLIGRISSILNLPYDSKVKWRLFHGLIRLTVSYAWKSKLLHSKANKVTLFGVEMEFVDWETFRHLFEEIFLNRIYDIKIQEGAPFIIDCGSNIGMSIIFFKTQHPDSLMVGFEPDRDNFICLTKNIQRACPDVVLHNKAVADQAGITTLFSMADEGYSTTKTLFKDLLGAAPASTQTVESVRLSAFISRKVTLLKLDVEGAETSILHDLIASGKISLVENIIVEYHDVHDTREHSLASFLNTLTEQGYIYTLAAQPRFGGVNLDVSLLQHVLVYAKRTQSSNQNHREN